ncbi:MAG: DUF1788 domain-containing protein [Desulfoplanes sp.]|nr:DUF1788 domain-containing protein [Desulfoplanes sp.]
MILDFNGRLNKITDRLLSRELLANAGLGNDIGFYIFDYPPAKELEVRNYLKIVEEQLSKRKPDLRYIHINLFELIIQYLKKRKILEPAFALQKTKGDDELLNALKGPLHSQKIAEYFVQAAHPAEHDLVLMSGVGNAWPLLRGHNLLNCLHPLMGDTPLVMFYPGHYSGQGLCLFGKLAESNYYRAFALVS